MGNKGNRAMGACITNKIISWHALLPHKTLHKSFLVTRIRTSHATAVQSAKYLIIMYLSKPIFANNGTGTRDIDPRSSPSQIFHIIFFLSYDVDSKQPYMSYTLSIIQGLTYTSDVKPDVKRRYQ